MPAYFSEVYLTQSYVVPLSGDSVSPAGATAHSPSWQEGACACRTGIPRYALSSGGGIF